MRLALLTTAALLFAALAFWASGVGNQAAIHFYNPHNRTAWLIREWSNLLPLALSFGFLFLLLFPALTNTRPYLRRTAAVWVLTALLGVGLINQVMIKQSVQRPRPRESVLVTADLARHERHGNYITTRPTVALKGNSMPSGHTGTAFLLLVPFFTLRRKYPKTAKTILLTGLAYGTTVAWARMTLGAHFLSDILVSLAINVAAAALFARLIQPETRISPLYPAALLLIAGSVILTTKKIDATLNWAGTWQQLPTFDLPCPVNNLPATYPATGKLTVHLKGKGLPETWVYLTHTPTTNTFNITHYGFQHHLTCTAGWQPMP